MRKRIQRKVNDLRQQPEHVRMRAASIFTVVGGIVAVALWLVVFLPLQLRLNSDSQEPAPAQEQVANDTLPDGGTLAPQVGGVQDVQPLASPTPQIFITPGPSVNPTPTLSPTPEPLP
ncbi:MAG: hypothetical protein WEC84_00835 [Candidatus Andersenbacteria bacterium]